MKHPVKHWIEYGALRGVAGLVNVLPYSAALVVGWLIAAPSFWLAGRKRRMAYRRLKQVFGDSMTPRQRLHVAWLAWRNLMFNAVEAMRVPSLRVEQVRRIWNVEDVSILGPLRESGRGVILAVPHMGNWELAGVSLQLLVGSVMTIARKQKNLLISEYMIHMREYFGLEAFYRESKSFAGVVRKLQSGSVLALPVDLRAKQAAVRVKYLGVETDVPAGAGFFARQANVPIVPVVLAREGWAKHRWTAAEPILPDLTLDEKVDIQRMTQRVIDVFDRAVRERPEQYFWFNKRWVLGEEVGDQKPESRGQRSEGRGQNASN
jgi:lauroyl/myristoyl acyltransferase